MPSVENKESWGSTYQWPSCGHQAMVLGKHEGFHLHPCPICHPDRRPEVCDVEYLDAH